MYIYLDIVEQFACEMCGQCCRNDWQITLSETSYTQNARLFAATGRNAEFDTAFLPLNGTGGLGEYAYIAKQPSGGCWFLGSDNLCRLQREAGHSHLDIVCQTFPRYPINTSRGTELALSFSCPAVLKLAKRSQPLLVLRSERPPIDIPVGSYVADVYPTQQPIHHPLHYYFELEHHFIDILQCRRIALEARLRLMEDTVRAIHNLTYDEQLGGALTKIIYANYDFLDSQKESRNPNTDSSAVILIENFLISLVFKKPFYLYGLERAMTLLKAIWQQIVQARAGVVDSSALMERTISAIMAAEFQYCHNRSALHL